MTFIIDNSSNLEDFFWTTIIPNFDDEYDNVSNFSSNDSYPERIQMLSSVTVFGTLETIIQTNNNNNSSTLIASPTSRGEILLFNNRENGIVTDNNTTSCNFSDPYCFFFSEYSAWLRHSVIITVVYCLAYFTVFFLGVIGNSFVVAVVWRSPRMHTVTNYFIVNLALADLLVIILCLPATLLSNIFIPWVLGLFMCKTVVYVQGLSVAASIYSLVAVSFDRFLAICYPLKCQLTRARAKVTILVIWAVALVIPIPWAMYFELDIITPYYPDIAICKESWPNPKAEELYFGVGNLLLCYILPLLIISYCYIMIWVRVWSRSIIGETKDGQMQMMQKSKVKVVKMLVVVVILFMISWLPLYIIFARVKFGHELEPGSVEEQGIAVIAPIAQWLGSANSCINPILYAFFNKKYRKGFVGIVKSRSCCSKLGRNDEFINTFRHTHYHRASQRNTQVELVSTNLS